MPQMILDRLSTLTCAAVLWSSWWATPAHAEAVERGRALLSHYQCGSCHTIPGVASARGEVAQSLVHWRHRSYIAGRLANRPEPLLRTGSPVPARYQG